ncbi:MAG: CD3337/EF1877 family mobilome membrane protein [Lachnospiraceae bacterium]
MKYKIKMVMAMLLMCLGILCIMSITASAGGGAINGDVTDITNLHGKLGYINRSDLYYLDMKEADFMDWAPGMLNTIANVVFDFIKWLAKCTCMLFYHCMNFNLAEMLSSEINSIQEALRNNIFEPLFLIAFAGSAMIIIKKMLHRDMMGSFGQVLKVVGIMILSLWLVKDSGTAITATTNITKSISCQALAGMAGTETTDIASYAANSSGSLWLNLIHMPWRFIEFNGEPVTDDDIENKYLNTTYAPGTSERKELVKNYAGNAFSTDRGGEKIGFMLLYLIPFAIKCVIYIVMAVLSLVFQLIALLWLFLAPIVLLLAMIPGYEGVISTWLRKMLEAQLSILVMSFIIGLLIKIDDMLFSIGAETWGWLIVLIVQAVINVVVIIKRDELLGALSKVGAANPSAAINKSLHAGKQAASAGANAAIAAGKAGVAGAGLAARGISSVGMRTADIVKTNQQTAIMTAAGNYQMDYNTQSKRKVERPVMSKESETVRETVNREPVAVNGTVRPQNAPKTVSRPRMDNYSNVIAFDASRREQRGFSDPIKQGGDVKRPSMKPTQQVSTTDKKGEPTAKPAALMRDNAAARANEIRRKNEEPVVRPKRSVPPAKKDTVQDVKENIEKVSSGSKTKQI